jgi:hypothetical protein
MLLAPAVPLEGDAVGVVDVVSFVTVTLVVPEDPPLS